MTVLDVDDEVQSRRATLRLLRRAGYRTRQAASGEQALRIVARERPDLIVLNDAIEGARGPELAQQIKLLPGAASIPILHLAPAGVPVGPPPEEAQPEVDSYLSHPVDPRTLMALTRALLRARRAEAVAEELARARDDAERRARESWEYKQVLDSIMGYLPVAIWVVDAPEAKVRMVSKYGSRIAGRSAASMIGLSAEELARVLPLYQADGVTPVTAEEMHVVRAARYGEEAATQQWVVERPEGTRMTVLSTAGPICDRKHEIIGGVVVWQDITEQKQIQKELERLLEVERARGREAALLEAVLNNTPSAIACVDQEARYVLVNPAYVAASGRKREEIIGRSAFDFFPQPEYRGAYLRAVETGRPVSRREAPLELPARPEAGVTYWDFTLTPMREDGGEVIGVLLTAMEVTDKVRARQRLVAAERERAREARLLTTILEATPSLTAYVDRDLCYRMADSLYASGLGFSREGIIGKRHAEIFAHAPWTTEWLEQVRDKGQAMVVREIPTASPLPGREQEETRVDITMTPVKDERGEVEGVVVFVMDVTETVRHREKLVEAERARAELAETLNREINHRVKNNLMMVVGLLQMQIAGETETRTAAALHDAMTRLLTFAEIHTQLRFAATEEVDLLAMTQRIAEVTRSVFAKAEMEVQVEGEIVPCSAKECTPLLIVINELITNAVKHGLPAEDGKLHVQVVVKREAENVRISVWNSGNPVPEDFDPRDRRSMGMRLAWDVVVGRFQGSFAVRPERGGTRAEVVVSYGSLRE